MKRLITIGVALLAVMSLTACSSSSKDSKSASSSKNSDVHTVKTETKRSQYFKNNFLKLNEMTLKITKTKLIPAGNKGNEYSDKTVFAVWYTIKNTGKDTDIDAVSAALVLSASQDSKNSVKSLEVASNPDQKLTDIQDDKIKKGKSGNGSMAWEVRNNNPITLTATGLHTTTKIGTQVYKIK